MQTKDIERGRLAKDVLENAVYRDAFDGIKRELYNRWLTAENVQERENLSGFGKMLDKVESSLRATMVTGEIELANLEHKQKRTLREVIGL